MVEMCLHARWYDEAMNETGPDGCNPCCHVWAPPTLDNCCNFTNATDPGNNTSWNATPHWSTRYTCAGTKVYYRQLCHLMSEEEVPPGAELLKFRIVPNPRSHEFPDVFAGRGKRRDT